MAINAASITNKTVRIKSPSGTFFSVDSVVYTASNGQATYSISRVFSFTDNGSWEVWTGDPVLDGAGNPSIAGKLGSFTVNIPAPPVGDQIAPTMTLVSVTPSTITTAGSQTISIVVSISDS